MTRSKKTPRGLEVEISLPNLTIIKHMNIVHMCIVYTLIAPGRIHKDLFRS